MTEMVGEVNTADIAEKNKSAAVDDIPQFPQAANSFGLSFWIEQECREFRERIALHCLRERPPNEHSWLFRRAGDGRPVLEIVSICEPLPIQATAGAA